MEEFEELPYDQIDAFLKRDMSKSEQEAFKSVMLKNPKLAEAVAIMQSLSANQGNPELSAFEKTLESVSDHYFEDRKPLHDDTTQTENHSSQPLPNRIQIASIWKWAAIAALLLGAVFTYMVWPQERSYANAKELYSAYADHQFALREMNNPIVLNEIQSLLDQKNYAQAIPLLSTFLQENPDRPEAIRALGIAQLEDLQYAASIATFKQLAAEHALFATTAHWYLGMVYLKQNDLVTAIEYFGAIPENSNQYEEAKNILKQIKILIK